MEIECWKTSSGKEEVLDQIDDLQEDNLKTMILDRLLIIGRRDLHNCLCSGLILPLRGTKPRIYELKIKDVRITLFVKEICCWLLTLFRKNSQKTPLKEIKKAEKRAKELI